MMRTRAFVALVVFVGAVATPATAMAESAVPSSTPLTCAYNGAFTWEPAAGGGFDARLAVSGGCAWWVPELKDMVLTGHLESVGACSGDETLGDFNLTGFSSTVPGEPSKGYHLYLNVSGNQTPFPGPLPTAGHLQLIHTESEMTPGHSVHLFTRVTGQCPPAGSATAQLVLVRFLDTV